MLNSKWSGKDVEKLTNLHANGYDDLQIATKLARTEKAICIKRSKLGLVKNHRPNKLKGKIKFPERAKPKRGRMPEGSQITIEGLLPNTGYEVRPGKNGTPEITQGSGFKMPTPADLPGNEELIIPGSISKTIISDVGISGTITIWNHDGEIDFNINGLSPRNAIHILAAIISKIV